MISPDEFYNIYQSLSENYNSDDLSNRQKYIEIFKIISRFYKKLYAEESRHFSSLLAGINFVNDKYNLKPELALKLTDILYLRRILRKNQNISLSGDEVKFILKYSYLIISSISNYQSDDEFTELINQIPEINLPNSKQTKRQLKDIIGAVVVVNPFYKKKIDSVYIEMECSHDELGTFFLKVGYPHLDNANMIYAGMSFNLISAEIIRELPFTVAIRSGGLFIFEPDYLIDATDLAESYGMTDGFKIYFLKKYFSSETSMALVKGNLINTLFDEIILNPEIEFETARETAFKQKPLPLFALLSKNYNNVKQLKNELLQDFERIKQIINYNIFPTFSGADFSVEPSFISPVYGIQGRMDLLAEYPDNIFKKDIIELKSGRAPSKNLAVKVTEQQVINLGVWQNHLAQVLCYNLLLDSTFTDRTGNSSILYIQAADEPIRDVASLHNVNQLLMLLRNNIILLENSIMHRSFKFFDGLKNISTEQLPSYITPKVNKFNDVYSHLGELEKNYLNEFSSFTLRERYAVKNGANQSNNDLGFSSLWKNSIEEKIADNSILTGLKLDLESSDLDSLNLTFNITETEFYSALRKGDIVILHSYLNSDDMNIAKNQLLKCVIKDITSDSIKVSLRNKLISKRILDESMLWAIESDQIDSVERYIFSSLFNFVNSPANLRNLIFGNIKPEFDNSYCCQLEGLNDNQKKIVQDAVNAKNYYLIQGPPGTGKTNLILKNIINELFNRTSENLLIAAYTNRAVDEIAGAIANISPEIPYIRIGSKEASSDYEHHLPQIIDKYGINEGYKRLKNTRVVISTISSLHTNAELFEVKKFDTLIVDEASQILETYLIGLLTRVKKFILIGDDKQLPPLTVQNPASLICDNQPLNSIGILNYSDSLFSRLAKICYQNNWNESLGSLIFQARMHADIQLFPSINFYNDGLRIMYENQNQNIEDFDLESDDIFEKMLAAGRMIFIDCPAEKGKINKVESDISYKLINIIQSKYKLNSELIGVISPFRVQCFEIYKRLDEYQKMFINVDTVERYQGSQRDFVIMSCAAGNNNLLERIKSEDYSGQVDRKLNVAITRAKSHFIMLGNSNVLCGSKHYRDLIEFIKSKKSYYMINI